MINLLHSSQRITSCFTHKMAIVSWPQTLWRHFSVCIQPAETFRLDNGKLNDACCVGGTNRPVSGRDSGATLWERMVDGWRGDESRRRLGAERNKKKLWRCCVLPAAATVCVGSTDRRTADVLINHKDTLFAAAKISDNRVELGDPLSAILVGLLYLFKKTWMLGIAASSSAKVIRYRNTILDTSGRRSITPIFRW